MIELRNVSLQAGEFVLHDVSLQVPEGGYAVLMGRTGSGKTTILESIIGLRQVTAGEIWLCGRHVTHCHPAVRGVGFVPQDGALFSRMSVQEQMALALVVRRVPPELRRQRVGELAEVLGITHLLHRRPRGLSGGERQRVALGRALSFRPPVLCLDEPLSALDDDTRGQICELLRKVTRQYGVTTLHITHNAEEARQLADRVFRIEGGAIRELGTTTLASLAR